MSKSIKCKIYNTDLFSIVKKVLCKEFDFYKFFFVLDSMGTYCIAQAVYIFFN